MRTLGRNGRPKLESYGSAASPVNEDEDDENSNDDSPGTRGIAIEAAAIPEASQAIAREQSSGNGGQRRNTVGRKHSASTAGNDQAAREPPLPGQPEESMHKLAEKFESLRKETDEITKQMGMDAENFESQMAVLIRDKESRDAILKEKQKTTEELKKDASNHERQNRIAQEKKTKKEKEFNDKLAQKTRRKDDMNRWRNEIDAMKLEREDWRVKRQCLEEEKEETISKLRDELCKHQQSTNRLEEEIHVKGLQIKELELARKTLPGSEDDGNTREIDEQEKLEDLAWENTEKLLLQELNTNSHQLREIGVQITRNQNDLSLLQASIPIMYSANSSGVDFDPTGAAGKAKSRRTRNRKSRTNTISSPIAAHPITNSPFPASSMYNNLHNSTSPSFAQGPYIDMSSQMASVGMSDQTGMSEEEIRQMTGGAPLSPTVASSLLPSNIFSDDFDDPPSPGSTRSFGPPLPGSTYFENDPQSPHSSSRSASLVSSPQSSSHNLAMYGVSSRDYGVESDRRSLNSPRTAFGVIGSTASAEQSAPHKLKDMFTFNRTRGKTMQDDGPTLGSLKHGQSQSFPRSTEEPETLASKHRRISFSSGNIWNPFQRGTPAVETSAQGNAPAPARIVGARRQRTFNIFNSNVDENTNMERNPSSPRPLSVASSDLPRPSTDSAPFGWAPPDVSVNRNSPLATNWSIHAPATWSRNPSRRPSIQYASTTALTSGIASEDDEFLPPSDSLATQSSPPPVGVIGTRPVSSHKPITPKLNPLAPDFTHSLFSRASKSEKEKDAGKGKVKAVDTSTAADDALPTTTASSPSASRYSRDTTSIHTQNSITESYDSLEKTASNSASDMNTASNGQAKEPSFTQRLLRKGSSGKFSLGSIRNFTGKKAPGSAANSDRNASTERDGSFDEAGEDHRRDSSVTSSPMLGSNTSGEFSKKESRMSKSWGKLPFGKSKAKGNEDIERSESELTTEDEGGA